MTERFQRQSPLSHLGLFARARAGGQEDAGGSLCESRPRRQIALRGDIEDPSFVRAIEQATGHPPPSEPNTVVGSSNLAEGPRLLWLGPDEWLVVADDTEDTDILAALGSAINGQHATVVDVSDGRTVIAITGTNARDVLAKGCSLDMHPKVFGAGRCAQTLIAHAHVILQRMGDAAPYEIYVHRSYADYLWRWLEDSAGEYGVRVTVD